ncbi:MAG: ribonuclease III domain-containing protein [Cyanobacteria bacterium P01_D01_bin.73]
MVADTNAYLATEPESHCPTVLDHALAQLFWPRLGFVMSTVQSLRAQTSPGASPFSSSTLQSSENGRVGTLANAEVGLEASSESDHPTGDTSSSAASGSLKPLPFSEIARLSPSALAYIGDAVYELHIRSQFLFPPRRQRSYHQQVVAQVRAEQQASALASLEHQLTDDEKEWVRRGRNSVGKRSRHNNPVAYQNATAFETLIGYLFLTNPARLATLLLVLGSKESNGDQSKVTTYSK